MPYADESKPIRRPLFSGSYSKTWETSEGDIVESDRIIIKKPSDEVGLWSLFIKGHATGSPAPVVNLTVSLYFYIGDTEIYSGVSHTIRGWTTGSDSYVTQFEISDGFEARLDTQEWWLYNPDGFKLVFSRDSNNEIVFDYTGVKAL